jgi:hypothetical protein
MMSEQNDPQFTVERGESMRIRERYDAWISPLKLHVQRLETQRDKELHELQQRCTPHEDDGAMFHGFCARCGAILE